MAIDLFGGGGVPLGSIVQMQQATSPLAVVEGQTFLKNGFYVTQGYDPSLDYMAKSPLGPDRAANRPNVATSRTGGAATDRNGTWLVVSESSSSSNMWKSTDNGLTWSVAFTSGALGRAIDTDGAGVWVTAGTSFRRSIDDGVTWATVTGATHYGLRTDRDGVWVAVGGSGSIWRSEDNGASFTSITPLNAELLLRVDTDDQGVWVAVSNSGGIIRSADNGVTWDSMIVPALPGVTPALRDVATDGTGMWLATGSNSIVLKSTDNGVTWTLLPVFGSVTTVTAAGVGTDRNGTWIVAGPTVGHASVSRDAGATWISVQMLGSILDAFVTDRNGTWMTWIDNTSSSPFMVYPGLGLPLVASSPDFLRIK